MLTKCFDCYIDAFADTCIALEDSQHLLLKKTAEHVDSMIAHSTDALVVTSFVVEDSQHLPIRKTSDHYNKVITDLVHVVCYLTLLQSDFDDCMLSGFVID